MECDSQLVFSLASSATHRLRSRAPLLTASPQECWTDPLAYPPQKALENIGKALQAQYERWQPRARYKQCLDPTVEDVKKLCLSLRRNAKEERVLFHYNGHGVRTSRAAL